MGSTSTTLELLYLCFNEGTKNLSSISVNLSHLLDPAEQDETQSNLTLKTLYPDARHILNRVQKYVGETGTCQEIFDEVKYVSLYYTKYSPMYIIPMNIKELVEERFPYARYNYSSNIQYQECVALETELLPQIDGDIVVFRDIEELLMNLTSSEIQESLILSETLSSYYNKIINVKLIYHKYERKLNEACNWIIPVLSHQNFLLWKFTSIHGTPLILLKDVETSLDKIRNIYLKLHQYYSAVIYPDIDILQNYLTGNITKMELGKKIKSMEESWDVLYQLKEELQTHVTEYSSKMTLTKDYFVQFYELYLTLDFPIINRENVNELEMVEEAAAINDSRLEEIVNNLKVDVLHYLPQLIKECFKRLINSMEEVAYGLGKPVEDMLEQLDELRNDLDIYQRSTRMDT